MPAYAVDPDTIRRIRLDVPPWVCNPAVMGHTMQSEMLPDSQAPQASGWRAASFAISTPQGRLDVDGIVRSPFGIDQRTIDEAGTRGWSVTHLPSGLAVVRQIARETGSSLPIIAVGGLFVGAPFLFFG